jgi:uncharacterized YccA/Bax inhibitor family protein
MYPVGGPDKPMTTGNPVLRDDTFSVVWPQASTGQAMTINGTIHKACFLLLCVLTTAVWAWDRLLVTHNRRTLLIWLLVALLAGFVVALVTVFKKQWSPVTAPIYALLQGLLLGTISSLMEARFPGIAVEAVALTFATCFGLLVAYRSGLIRATNRFRFGITAATSGLASVYLLTLILRLLGMRDPFDFGSGPVGILVCLVIVALAALNLILDFDFIERGARTGAPKYMEWYAAFGLMVTLIWLYLEVLRLLAKVRDDRS